MGEIKPILEIGVEVPMRFTIDKKVTINCLESIRICKTKLKEISSKQTSFCQEYIEKLLKDEQYEQRLKIEMVCTLPEKLNDICLEIDKQREEVERT